MEKIKCLNTLSKTNTQKGLKLMSYYTIVENGIKKANPNKEDGDWWNENGKKMFFDFISRLL